MRLLALIVGVLLVGGCAVSASDTPASSGTPTGSTPTPPPLADPVVIQIPKIGANSGLIPLGLNDDGSLEVPPVDTPLLGGWYAGADPILDGDEVKPGERGSAVVAAHVDGVIGGQKGQPGLFYRLHELIPGDEIFVEQSDGSKLRFLVERVETHDKDAFPSEAVYLADDMPRLNLVTCGGAFDRAEGHYEKNVIVFSTLAPELL